MLNPVFNADIEFSLASFFDGSMEPFKIRMRNKRGARQESQARLGMYPSRPFVL